MICDGLVHCKDGSDESFERCTVAACPPEKFQCKHSKQCIPRSFLCDGNPDCSDKSDEMENCTECPEFRCNNGLCVQYDKVCDGINQCGDFTDEEHCSYECKKGEYFCHPKGCLTQDKLCNGEVDCYNAFDEEGCINTTTTINPNTREKVYQTEKNHTKTHHCGAHEFQCTNWSECIPLVARCDSYQDCFDR